MTPQDKYIDRELTQKPIFFERNRVWRLYKGGMLFHDLMGEPREDGNWPEEWLASTVEALNETHSKPGEGLSIIKGTDITLRELTEKYPAETIGSGQTLELLVKYLDSAVRLPMQVHPDREFSQKHFNSTYGKTEMWLVLAGRKNAGIYFGFRDRLTKKQLAELIERSKTEKGIMDKYLNKVSVNPGEVYLIPGKAVHAIGAGCLMLEIQEPADFTIQPEYWCAEHLLSRQEMYAGLSKDAALDCFDYSLYGSACIEKARKKPAIIERNGDYEKEALMTAADTPCFLVNRYYVHKTYLLAEAPSIYVVLKGAGRIRGDGFIQEIKKGDYFFLPKCAAQKYQVAACTGKALELISCMPPHSEK